MKFGIFVSEPMMNQILRKCLANCGFESGHILLTSLSSPNLIRAIFESKNRLVELEALDVDSNLINLNYRLRQRGVRYVFTVKNGFIGVFCQLAAREVILTSSFEGVIAGSQTAVVKADLFNCNPNIHDHPIYKLGCESGASLFFTRLSPSKVPTSETELLDIVNEVFANSTFIARSRAIVPVFNWETELLISIFDGVVLSNPESQEEVSLLMPFVKVQLALGVPYASKYVGQVPNFERFDVWPAMIYCEKDGCVIWACCQV